jgi:hypothetical protein
MDVPRSVDLTQLLARSSVHHDNAVTAENVKAVLLGIDGEPVPTAFAAKLPFFDYAIPSWLAPRR